MKKFLGFLALAAFVLPAALVGAQTDFPQVELEPIGCFDDGLYEFQSVEVSVGPESQNYNSGDTIQFIGDLINNNPYPVVDGNVFVRISRTNPDFFTDGHHTVDEFIAVSDVSIPENGTQPITFEWQVPEGAANDEYRADYFFSVSKKFNLGGLPFTNEIIVGFSSFDVESTNSVKVAFDREGTTVNGSTYGHIGEWPRFNRQESIEFVQPINNFSNNDVDVDVTYDLYYWDGLDESDLIESKSETITVPAGSSADAVYNVDSIDESVYYLKITAENDGVKSIVNLRTVTSDIIGTRINYPAINNFPLEVGDSAKVFSCYHTTGAIMEDVTLAMTITDKGGREVFTGMYTGDVSGFVQAAAADFIADDEYTYLKLNTELRKGTELLDSNEVVYDCSVINSEKCAEMLNSSFKGIAVTSAIIIIIIGLVLMVIGSRFETTRPELRKNLYTIGIVVIVLAILFGLLSLFSTNFTIAETTSADGKTKTQANYEYWDWGWTGTSGRTDAGNRHIANGWAGFVYDVTLDGEFDINVGETVSFTSSTTGLWNLSGGVWDTPYLGDSISFSDDGNNATMTMPAATPTFTVTSSDDSVMSCTGTTCTANGEGSAVITTALSSVVLSPTGSVEIDLGTITHSDGPEGRVLRLCDDGSSCNKDGTSKNEGPFDQTSLTIPGYSTTWTINISENPVPGVCGTAHEGEGTDEPTDSAQQCSGGTFDDIEDTTTGQYDWICRGQNGGADSGTCYVTEPAPVIGSCGSANGGTFDSQPTDSAQLCSSGTYEDLTDESGEFNWICRGQNGDADSDPCSATDGTAIGICNPVYDGATFSTWPNDNLLCNGGTVANKVEGDDDWSWNCTGAVSSASCTAEKGGSSVTCETDGVDNDDDGEVDESGEQCDTPGQENNGGSGSNGGPGCTGVCVGNDDNNRTGNPLGPNIYNEDIFPELVDEGEQCTITWAVLDTDSGGTCTINDDTGTSVGSESYQANEADTDYHSHDVDPQYTYTITCNDGTFDHTSVPLICVLNLDPSEF